MPRETREPALLAYLVREDSLVARFLQVRRALCNAYLGTWVLYFIKYLSIVSVHGQCHPPPPPHPTPASLNQYNMPVQCTEETSRPACNVFFFNYWRRVNGLICRSLIALRWRCVSSDVSAAA
jgi:hypothetical protein